MYYSKKPDAPIGPGKSGEIIVRYDTKRVGPFRKINDTKEIYNFLINSGMEGTKIFVE